MAPVSWALFEAPASPAVAAAEVAGASPERLFERARALAAEGKAREARSLWEALLAVDPNEGRAAMVANGWVITATDGPYPEGRHYPAWSPDGTRILFGYGALGCVRLQDGQVNSIQTDGTKLEVHRWSPDGRYVIARSIVDKHPHVRLWRREGEASLQSTDRIPQPYEAVQGEFSPDGHRLLLSGVTKVMGAERVPMGILVRDLVSGAESLVRWRDAERPARNHASWSPDGKAIVFQAYGSQKPADRAVFAMCLDARQSPVLLSGAGGGNCALPRVSPCGRSVAYHREGGGGPETVMLARIDGDGPPCELAEGRQPAWSPDGTMLAYDTPAGIVIAHLGGMPPSPFEISASAVGEALRVEVRNTAEVEHALTVGCRLFDAQSMGIASGPLCAAPVVVPPGKGIRGEVGLPPGPGAGARTALLTVVSATGARALALVRLEPRP